MKKIGLFILLGLFAQISFAQTDMASALQAIGENVTYTEYWDVRPVAGAKNTIGGKRYVATLKPVKNRFGKIVGLDAIDKEDGEKRIRYDYMYNSFDNYTHPSYMTAAAEHAYVIINGVIFYLEHFENINSFEIDAVWIPSVPKDRSGDAVFQGGKMSDMKSADLMKLVKDYFVAMKKIQEANPYNEAAQAEADAMKFTKDSTQVMYSQVNANYWSSPEGQKKLGQMRKAKVTLLNDTGADFLVCYGQGVSTTLKPGEKKEFSCDNGKSNKGKVRA
ncbi:MAG: hypothetical protein M3R17_17450, partial [Bacteroidota bacterium]|nr:hypothetical protein [Bacteroidota bacterium]